MANRLSHSLDHIEKHTPLSSHEENMDASTSVKSKNGQEIQEGDHVYTRIRGGRHEGDVDKVVTSQQDAEAEDVKNPPKVLFTDQKGKDVAHNPGTLDVTSEKE